MGELITRQSENLCLDKCILIEQIISLWVRNMQTYLCYYLYNLFEGADGFSEVRKLQVTEVMKECVICELLFFLLTLAYFDSLAILIGFHSDSIT